MRSNHGFIADLLEALPDIYDELPKPNAKETREDLVKSAEEASVLVLVYGQPPSPKLPSVASHPPGGAGGAPPRPSSRPSPPDTAQGPSDVPTENRILFAAQAAAGNGSLTVENGTDSCAIVKMIELKILARRPVPSSCWRVPLSPSITCQRDIMD